MKGLLGLMCMCHALLEVPGSLKVRSTPNTGGFPSGAHLKAKVKSMAGIPVLDRIRPMGEGTFHSFRSPTFSSLTLD